MEQIEIEEIKARSALAQNPGDYKEEAVEAWEASADDVPALLREVSELKAANAVYHAELTEAAGLGAVLPGWAEEVIVQATAAGVVAKGRVNAT